MSKKHSILIAAVCGALALTAATVALTWESPIAYKNDEYYGFGLAELHFAALSDDPAAIQAQLDKGVPVDFPAENGDTALMFAASEGCEQSVATLLKAGANPNARGYRGNTPLMLAVTRCIGGRSKVGIVKMLLAAGADVNAQNDNGGTALMCCMFGSNPYEIAQILLDAGADATLRTTEGHDALYYLEGEIEINTDFPELRQLLISAGAGKPEE